ncbi:hypothetical protein SAMN02787076_02042 [Rhizobacter sp. OV335]|nr:hypothetical protein SAMN02787076_02042 [Rhizobacter sp. OV335]
MDQQIVQSTSASYLAGRYTNTFNRLAQRASIARVYVQVSSDLACTAVPFGGGVAANTLMVLDGKMLDLMADVANGLAMRESGRTSLSLLQIVDLAASQQMSFSRFCQAADPLAFPDASLTPGELDRSVELFTQMTGGTFFHEFGHIWNWHSLAKLREQIFVPGGGLFTYTSVIEDNADIISGILNAKSGHAQSSAELAYDLMAFTVIYRRNPGGYSFGNTTSWQTQYQQTSPTYSSLATRKALLSSGFSGWRSH